MSSSSSSNKALHPSQTARTQISEELSSTQSSVTSQVCSVHIVLWTSLLLDSRIQLTTSSLSTPIDWALVMSLVSLNPSKEKLWFIFSYLSLSHSFLLSVGRWCSRFGFQFFETAASVFSVASHQLFQANYTVRVSDKFLDFDYACLIWNAPPKSSTVRQMN